MKEKRNRFFVAQHEGTENNDDMVIAYASTRTNYGSNDDWMELIRYIKKHDLSSSEHYDYVKSKMDVNSFMDYMICEIYVGNSDYANIQYYKLPEGKWKWIYYDFCWGFNKVNHKTLHLRRGSRPAGSDLFNSLLKNPEWRDDFIRRFAEIMNTVYTPERVNEHIDKLYSDVEPEIAREREKFNQSTFMGKNQFDENIATYDKFLSEIDYLRKFANERPVIMKAQIQKEFKLSDNFMAELFGESSSSDS
jgi:spore coat protein CotH